MVQTIFEPDLPVVDASSLPHMRRRGPVARVLEPVAPLPEAAASDVDARVVDGRHLPDVRVVPGIVGPELRQALLSHLAVLAVVVVLKRGVTSPRVYDGARRQDVDDVAGDVAVI